MNDEVLTEYDAWVKTWASSDTREARIVLVASRLKAWGPPATWTPEIIGAWLASDTIRSQWTYSTYFNHLNCFCRWLVATGKLEDNPMSLVRKRHAPESHPRPLTETEIAAVLLAATGHKRTWILLSLLAGLRSHEVAKIRGEDVQQDGIYVFGKGRKAATLPTHPEIWALAQTYPRRGYWFPSARSESGHIQAATVTKTISLLFDSLGIKGSLHRCRHSYGTRLLREGVNIRVVQKLLRHTNLSTTAIYTAVDEDEQRAAINRLTA